MRRAAGQTAALALVALALGSCRCGEDLPVRPARSSFQPDIRVVDFGRRLEGTRADASVEVISTGRADVSVQASTSPPFTTDPLLVLTPGERGALGISFTAGSEFVERDLVLRSAGEDGAVVVKLRGTGVRPLVCLPQALCAVSTFDVESGTCIDSVAPEGTPCVHPNPCLINGRCDALGQCVADPRPCDDNNLCTNDSCSVLVGCVNVPRLCPPSGRVCHVATCHPTNGCGEAPAPLGTLCGPVDCVTANLCDNGACRAAPTPDGFPCSAPTPCQGPGTCHNQTCLQPDAGVFPPTFSLPLNGAPAATPDEPGLLLHRGNLYAELCGPAYDGGCALVSWTSTAFERFAAPHGAARSALAATDAGVWMLGSDALSLHRLDTGAPLLQAPLASLPPAPAALAWTATDRYAADLSGALWVAVSSVDAAPDSGTPDAGNFDAGDPDGGDPDAGDPDAGDPDAGPPDAGPGPGPSGPRESFVRVLPDGGVERFSPSLPAVTEHRLALARDGALYAFDRDAGLSRLSRDDAGALALEAMAAVQGAPAVIAGAGRVLAGNVHVFDPAAGAVVGALDWQVDAGELEMLHRRTLLAPSGGVAFFRDRADGGAYAMSFHPPDGGRRWIAELVSPGDTGFVADAVLTADGGLGALVQVAEPDGGVRTELQLYFDGERLFSCPLPPGSQVAASAFSAGALQALILRDGGWALEVYDLTGAPLDLSGWPAPNSASGTRREH